MNAKKKTDPERTSQDEPENRLSIPPAVQTPENNGRKRLLSTTPPPGTGSPTEKNDTEPKTIISPTLKQDSKRIVLVEEDGKKTVTGSSTTPKNAVNKNLNNIDNLAAINSEKEASPSVPRGRRGRRGGRTSTRSVSRRRVPQPRAHSVDTTSPDIIPAGVDPPNDILSAILNMKNEITNSKNEIFGKIDDKIDNLKIDFRKTVSEMKENIDDINIDISGLTENQIKLQQKVESVSLSVNANTDYISSMKTQNDTAMENVHEHVTQIETDLATDIETLKLNIEEKLVERNDTLDTLKDQLTTLKSEYTAERDKNREEFRKLFDDYSAIRSQIEGAFENQVHTENRENQETLIKQPIDNNGEVYYRDPVKAKENVERLKNIVIDGLYESPTENLKHIVVHMCHDMNTPISPDEVIEAKRIGPPDQARRWPRPVRVTFSTETTRMRIYEDRENLLNTRLFNNVRLNADEPKAVRIRRAKLRQAAELAKKAGKQVRYKWGEIIIDGIIYNTLNVEDIPAEYQAKSRVHTQTQSHPQHQPPSDTEAQAQIHIEPNGEVKYTDNRKPFRVAYRRLKDGQTKIEMVGPCLQKTKKGLAFISGKCFLSNFFKCAMRYNGFDYKSSEQCWQAQKALICNDPIAMAEIKSAKEPLDAKRAGDRIIENDHWRRIKIDKMIDILQHKFRQNRELYYMLINTRPFNLIEASLDGFWGAHCKLYSVALQEGTWTGQNILGRILVDIRTDLCREEEAKRLHSARSPTHTHNRAPPTIAHNIQSQPLPTIPRTTQSPILDSSPMQVDIFSPKPKLHNTRL